MRIKEYNLKNKQVQFLINTDDKLARLIKHLKTCHILIEDDDFRCLVKYIIGQQISDKTREVIWNRLCDKYKDISPKTMNNTSEVELKQLGICRKKANYIKNLSISILNKEIDFKEFKDLPNQEIIKRLVKIKGIGNWTVEMYLIFSLGRENVISRGDNTIQRVLKWMYNLETLPTSKEVETYFEKWSEYSTIVSAYFWKVIAKDLMKQNFNNLK